MKTLSLAYCIIIIAVLLYVPKNKKIIKLLSDKFGIKRANAIIKLYKICGTILSVAIIIKIISLIIGRRLGIAY